MQGSGTNRNIARKGASLAVTGAASVLRARAFRSSAGCAALLALAASLALADRAFAKTAEESVGEAYSCSSVDADQAAYDASQKQMRDYDARRAQGENVEDAISQTLHRNQAIVDCFTARNTSPNQQSFAFVPTPSPTATALPFMSEADLLTGLLKDMRDRLALLQSDQDAIEHSPGDCTIHDAMTGAKSQLLLPQIKEEIAALQQQIPEMQNTQIAIASGARPANLTCDAICNRDEQKTDAVIADAQCNSIESCRKCRTAFMATTSSVGPSSVNAGADSTVTGRIGVIGNTCLGYRSAVGQSAAIKSAIERWENAARLCDTSHWANYRCEGWIVDALHDVDRLFEKWESDNKAQVVKLKAALAEFTLTVDPYPKVSPLQVASEVLGTDSNGKVSYGEAFDYGHVGLFHQIQFGPGWAAAAIRQKNQMAQGSRQKVEDAIEQTCSFIRDYTLGSGRADAVTASCTVYTGYLLENQKKVAAQTIPSPVPSSTSPVKTPEQTIGGTPGSQPGAKVPNTILPSAPVNEVVGKVPECGNLKGGACDAYRALLAPSAGPGDDPARFASLATSLSAFAKANPRAAERISSDYDAVNAKQNVGLPLGDRMAVLNPSLSRASRDALNASERSMTTFLKKNMKNEEGATAPGGTPGLAGDASPSSIGQANSQALRFGAAGVAPSTGSGSDFAEGLEISSDTALSLFERINQTTLRKQKTMQLSLYPPLLARNRSAFGSNIAGRLPASTSEGGGALAVDPTEALLFKQKGAAKKRNPRKMNNQSAKASVSTAPRSAERKNRGQ